MKAFRVLTLLVLLFAGCGPAVPSPTPVLPTVGSSPRPTETAVATPSPTALPSPSPTPTSSPSAVPPTPALIEGHWIQNTTREGLCTDSPRFIEFDSRPGYFISTGGSTVCSIYSIAPHTTCGSGSDCPRRLYSWRSVDVPGLDRVTGGTYIHPGLSEVPNSPECYDLPSFAGSGGRCAQDLSDQWQCLTPGGGLPFDGIRAYGVVEETGVEWFMSEDTLASRGMEPEDQLYAFPSLIDDPEVRLTWLSVPWTAAEGVWVGTAADGVFHVLPETEEVLRYTTADGLPSDEIRDVQTCGPGCVWLATSQGIGRWDGSQWTTYTTRDGLPSDDVRGISFEWLYQRDVSDVWAATAAGPALLDRGADRWQAVPGWPEGIEMTGVMGGWFGTRGHGLMQFIEAPVAHGTATSFTTADGLPDNRVTALAVTERGMLAGTPGGAVEWDGAA